jgi:hypothetical protein
MFGNNKIGKANNVTMVRTRVIPIVLVDATFE